MLIILFYDSYCIAVILCLNCKCFNYVVTHSKPCFTGEGRLKVVAFVVVVDDDGIPVL